MSETNEPTILEKAAGLVDTFDNLVKTEFDKVETEAAKIESEVVATVETDIVAPVENLIEPVVATAEQEVKKIREVFVHPEIGQTRPVINTTLPHGGGSVVKNPA